LNAFDLLETVRASLNWKNGSNIGNRLFSTLWF